MGHVKTTKLYVMPQFFDKVMGGALWKRWSSGEGSNWHRHRVEGPAAIYQNGMKIWERWDQ
jgi:hypothetical protein